MLHETPLGTYKECPKCKQSLPIENFNKSCCRLDGRQPHCNLCRKGYKAQVNDYTRARQRERVRNKRKTNPKVVWADRTIRTHRNNDYIVNLTVEDLQKKIEVSNFCPYCGVEFTWGRESGTPTLPSLDRINNEEIMIPKNTQIICLQCNKSKGSRTHYEFMDWIGRVYNRSF